MQQPAPASPRLILASSSRYRAELLSRLRLPFECISPDIDEVPLPEETPELAALRLARQKAEVVARKTGPSLVIGSDQVATLDGAHIGKPGIHECALKQLQQMRGREVIFHTAVCLVDSRDNAPGGRIQLQNVQTCVHFRALGDAELDAYLRIEKPYDCAGSAKNEGLGIALISRIDSTDPSALTGLPLIALTTMLRRAGMQFFQV